MSAADLVSGLLGVVGSGGVTGLLGGGLSFIQQRSANRQKLEEMEINNKHNREVLLIEQAMQDKEQQAEIRVETITGENDRYLADSETLKASYQMAITERGDTATEGIVLRFVEGLRRLVRPFASYYAMAILTVLTVWMFGLWEQYGLFLSSDQVYEISLQLLHAQIYLSTTIVMWWFSSRGVTLHVGQK